jgi:hypothetical protein
MKRDVSFHGGKVHEEGKSEREQTQLCGCMLIRLGCIVLVLWTLPSLGFVFHNYNIQLLSGSVMMGKCCE